MSDTRGGIGAAARAKREPVEVRGGTIRVFGLTDRKDRAGTITYDGAAIPTLADLLRQAGEEAGATMGDEMQAKLDDAVAKLEAVGDSIEEAVTIIAALLATDAEAEGDEAKGEQEADAEAARLMQRHPGLKVTHRPL